MLILKMYRCIVISTYHWGLAPVIGFSFHKDASFGYFADIIN